MAENIATPSPSDSRDSAKTTDEHKKRHVTGNERNFTNFEQYMLNRNLDKVENFYNSNQHLFGYRTFRQINGPASKIINKLKGISDLEMFYGMKNSVLSLMHPKIRLFKVAYEEPVYEPDGRLSMNKVNLLPRPCYKEFRFSDNFGQEQAASTQDYLSYESTKPSFRNVALQEFNIYKMGVATDQKKETSCAL